MVSIGESRLIGAPAERCFDLARSVEVHLLGNRHSGESAIACGGRATDVMIRGIFRSMMHERAVSDGRTEMGDRFVFAAPLPVPGRIAEVLFPGRYMRLLRERNAVIRRVAESEEGRKYL